MSSSQKQSDPLPCKAMVWLYNVSSSTEGFYEAGKKIMSCFLDSLTRTKILTSEWVEETTLVCSRYIQLREGYVRETPVYCIRVRSPQPILFDDIDQEILSCGQACDSRAASLLVYYVSLQAVQDKFEYELGGSSSSVSFDVLHPVLTRYSSECTFSSTGDHFLHVCLRMHLPSWCTMMSYGGGYRELSELLGESANKIVRPYLDVKSTHFMRTLEVDTDDVIFFVVFCSLIAEACDNKDLSVKYNRDVLFSPPDLACPFVFCDFPVPGINGDAYGYVVGKRLVICNSLGVRRATSLWIEELGESAPVVHTFLNNSGSDSTNLLNKYR